MLLHANSSASDLPSAKSLSPTLRLIADGKSNQDIATELVINFNTVTNHVKNILGKTGCANRTEAAAYAIPGACLASSNHLSTSVTLF